ncbi:MAG: hypothetical protein ABWY20_13650, partial [Mycobacterium sp.]
MPNAQLSPTATRLALARSPFDGCVMQSSCDLKAAVGLRWQAPRINTGSSVSVFTHQIVCLAYIFTIPQVDTPNLAGDRLGELHE